MLKAQLYTSKKQLIAHHSKDFCQEVGKLEGEYHICLNKDVIPVQHSPRQVPVALRDRLKENLNSLVTQGIIIPMTRSIPWVNSIAVVPKKDGSLQIFLGPKDLNRGIQREHYQLPTIEDIATQLHGENVYYFGCTLSVLARPT